MNTLLIEQAVQQLAQMTEPAMTLWLREALTHGPHPFPYRPDEPHAAILSRVPSKLPLDLAARFRASLVNLLVAFSSRPADWSGPEAEELFALASLLGTDALPGREPWDLGLAVSLAPLVSGNWETFSKLPQRQIGRVLALLRSGPEHLPPAFWIDLAARDYAQFATIAWRGLLRDDWLTACSRMLRKIPDTEAACAALRNHARHAARLIKAPRGEERLADLEAWLPLAKPGIRAVLEEVLAAESVRLAPSKAKTLLLPVSHAVRHLFCLCRTKLGEAGAHPLGALLKFQRPRSSEVLLLLDSFELAVRSGETEDWRVVSIAKKYHRSRLVQPALPSPSESGETSKDPVLRLPALAVEQSTGSNIYSFDPELSNELYEKRNLTDGNPELRAASATTRRVQSKAG